MGAGPDARGAGPADPLARIEGLLLDVDGVLTDGAFEPGNEAAGIPERKRFHSRDGLGLVMAKRSGLRVGFITGRASGVVRDRAAELDLDFLREGCFRKGPAFDDACREWGLAADRVAFVGDDVQDLPAMRRAGFSAAPADAHPLARKEADLVCSFPGGRGAVREVVERILAARGALEAAISSFDA